MTTKFQSEQSRARLQQMRQLLRKTPMTVVELAGVMQMSAPHANHYVRHLRDLGEIQVMEERLVGRFNTPANVWGVIVKAAPRPKPAPGKAKIINPPRRDVHTLTRWIGGNPFERLTA